MNSEEKIALLEKQIQESQEIKETILFIVSSVLSQGTIKEVLWQIVHNCIKKLGFIDCVIYLYHESSQYLIQSAALENKTISFQEIHNPIKLQIGQGIVGSVAQTKKAAIVMDTSIDSRYIVDDAARLSEIAVPIVLGDKLIGVIDSEHPEKNFYTQRHLEILSTIASLCAFKIDSLYTMEKMQRVNAQLRIAQKIAQMGSWEFHSSTGKLHFHQRVEEMMVKARPEPGLSFDEFEANLHPADAKTFRNNWKLFLEQDIAEPGYIRVHLNGHQRDILWRIADKKYIEFDKSGIIPGVFLDITDIRNLEKEKGHLVLELTKRNQALSQFNKIISHNLRAPVANIIGILQLLEHLESENEERPILQKELAHLASGVDSIIKDLNGALSHNIEMNEAKSKISFADIVQSNLELLGSAVKEVNPIFNIEYRAEYAFGFPAYLNSIFYNLLANALKYRDSNRQLVIEIETFTDIKNVHVVFKDNGRGINTSRSDDKIFGLYSRFHKEIEGKGLGLFITKQQIEFMGGNIFAEGKENEGLTIHIQLPKMQSL
jgi:signal transduction histidine kinase